MAAPPRGITSLSTDTFGLTFPSMGKIATTLSVISFLLVVIVLLMFLAHSVSFPRVFKNVHRKAYASVSVDASGNITLESVYDPYKVLTSATFGGSSANVAAEDGTVTVTLSKSKYDFTTSTVNASMSSEEYPGVISVSKTASVLTLTPFQVDSGTFTDYTGVLPYTFDLNVEFQQPATI
jgi:hypothetical protein